MIEIVFLVCALSLPDVHFNRPSIVSYHAIKSEEDQLRDWLRKNNPGADIFIHPNPRVDKLKEHGYERTPLLYRNQQIWIRRKPISDKRPKTSA